MFNANGIPQNTVPIIADFTGRNLRVSLPSSLASQFADPNGWTMKTLESSDDYDRRVALTALRFDGHYDFENDFKLDFGVRNSIRSADNDGFTLVTPVYAGIGRERPERVSGALRRCRRGLEQRRLAPRATRRATSAPGPCRAAGVEDPARRWRATSRSTPICWGPGITFWAIDPNAMDNPMAYWKSLYPDTDDGRVIRERPGRVDMKEMSGYLQGESSTGNIGSMPYSGNVGVRCDPHAISTSPSI